MNISENYGGHFEKGQFFKCSPKICGGHPFSYQMDHYDKSKSVIKPNSPKSGYGFGIFSLTKLSLVAGY